MDSAIQIKLTSIAKCYVYRLGPRPSAKGYLCKDWPQEDHVWTGRVVVYSKGEACIVSLEDSKTGALFASAPVTEEGPSSIERAIDSSRYFIIRVDDGAGHHAFIGLGFETREEGFDFIHSVGEHFRRLRDEKEAKESQTANKPATDYSIKDKIKIDFKLKPTSTAKPSSSPANTSNPDPTFAFFPPPPSSSSSSSSSLSSSPPASSSAYAAAASTFDTNSFFNFSAPLPPTQVHPSPSPPIAAPNLQAASPDPMFAFFTAPLSAPTTTTASALPIGVTSTAPGTAGFGPAGDLLALFGAPSTAVPTAAVIQGSPPPVHVPDQPQTSTFDALGLKW